MNWRQMALGFLREAQADLHVAEMLLAKKEFANSVEHSQHAAEEVIKSALFLKKIAITNDHFVAAAFGKNYPEHPSTTEIVAKARMLENEGNRSQYPTWDRKTGSVVSPSKEYNQATAQKFCADAGWIYRQIADFLQQTYQISLQAE